MDKIEITDIIFLYALIIVSLANPSLNDTVFNTCKFGHLNVLSHLATKISVPTEISNCIQ